MYQLWRKCNSRKIDSLQAPFHLRSLYTLSKFDIITVCLSINKHENLLKEVHFPNGYVQLYMCKFLIKRRL